MQPNLSPEEYATIAAVLRDTIAAGRYPLSPRVQAWRAILDKLDPPPPPPRPEPMLPQPSKPYVPSTVMAKKRRR